MDITYLGHSSFKLRGKSATLVTDPFNPEMLGLKFPVVAADIVTISHNHADHNYFTAVGGVPVIVSGPGEYEVKGVNIIGVSTYHDNSNGRERGKNTVYRINMDGISLVHCGDLGHKLSDKDKEIFSGCDVLMIPVGGFYTITVKDASEIVTQLEPGIVIPMHYKLPSTKQKIGENLAEVGVFLKEMGKEGIQSQPKLNITKDKLPPEMTVVVLES